MAGKWMVGRIELGFVCLLLVLVQVFGSVGAAGLAAAAVVAVDCALVIVVGDPGPLDLVL